MQGHKEGEMRQEVGKGGGKAEEEGRAKVEWSAKEKKLRKDKEALMGEVVDLRGQLANLQAENIKLVKEATFDRAETQKALKKIRKLTSDAQEFSSSDDDQEVPNFLHLTLSSPSFLFLVLHYPLLLLFLQHFLLLCVLLYLNLLAIKIAIQN